MVATTNSGNLLNTNEDKTLASFRYYDLVKKSMVVELQSQICGGCKGLPLGSTIWDKYVPTNLDHRDYA